MRTRKKERLSFLSFRIPWIILILGLVLYGGFGCSNDDNPVNPPEEYRYFTLLQTTDMHDHAQGYGPQADFNAEKTDDDSSVLGGYSRVATVMEEIKDAKVAEGIPVLTVDSGDYFMGTAYDLTGLLNPLTLAAMQGMAYDAITIGNHEFDWTPAGLYTLLKNAIDNGFSVPIVATNVELDSDSPLLDGLKELKKDGYIVDKLILTLPNGLRIGFLGRLSPSADLTAPMAPPVTFDHTSEFMQARVNDLKNNELVDLVILISHGGIIPPKTEGNEPTGDDVDIVKGFTDSEGNYHPPVTGIDIIASGHDHILTTKLYEIDNTYIFCAGWASEYVSQLDVTYSPKQSKIINIDYAYHTINDTIKGQSTMQAGVDAANATLNAMLEPITGYTLLSEIAKTDVTVTDLTFNATAYGETGLGRLCSDSYRNIANALAFAEGAEAFQAGQINTGTMRDSIYPGKTGAITFADVYATLPLGLSLANGTPVYPLMGIWFNGKDLRNLCEVGALVYLGNLGLLPAEIGNILTNDFYMNFSGIKYWFDPTRTPGKMVWKVDLYDVTDSKCEGILPLTPINQADLWQDSSTLYHVVVDLYYMEMISVFTEFKDTKYKLFKDLIPEPKDKDGNLIPMVGAEAILDYATKYRINAKPGTTPLTELKGWTALAEYLGSLQASSGGNSAIQKGSVYDNDNIVTQANPRVEVGTCTGICP